MPETTATKRGPKTEEGKRRSSMNALKHGFYAKSPQAMRQALETPGLILEPDVTLDDAREEMYLCHQPVDRTEDLLVERMALCMFRLSMFEGMARLNFARDHYRDMPTGTLVAVLKAERMAMMEFQRCLRGLNAKRAAEWRLAALKEQANTKSESSSPTTRHLEPETLNCPDIRVHLRSSAVDSPNHTNSDQKSVETNYSHEETEHEIVPSEPANLAVERFPETHDEQASTGHSRAAPDPRPLTPVSRRTPRHLRPGRHSYQRSGAGVQESPNAQQRDHGFG